MTGTVAYVLAKKAASSPIIGSEISDISIDGNSLCLVNSENSKIGNGVKLEDLAGSIADSSNNVGGIVSVINDDE